MSKSFISRRVPSKSESILEKLTCDICKKEKDFHVADVDRYNLDSCEWGSPGFSNKVQVSRHGITAMDDGGSDLEKKISFDICPQCFDKVLVPFLKHKGAEPTIFEVPY